MSKINAWYVTKDNNIIRGTYVTSWNKNYFIPNEYYNIKKFQINANDKNIFFDFSSAFSSIENKNKGEKQ